MSDAALFPFCSAAFSADECCYWRPPRGGALDMNEHYIAPPAPGQDHAAWRAAVRAFRDRIRKGQRGGDHITLNYDGERAWVRATFAAARALGLRSGDMLEAHATARGLRGGTTLGLAIDWLDPETGALLQSDPLGPRHAFAIGDTPEKVCLSTVLPDFDPAVRCPRPVFGIDFTTHPEPGEVDLLDLDFRLPDDARNAAARAAFDAAPKGILDDALYNRADLRWAASAWNGFKIFLYDQAIYDPARGVYTPERWLDAAAQFGGADTAILWQGYPRLGIDDRNQFDLYRDMPGGLDGLRALTRALQDAGVRVLIDYNPWDTGTRRPARSDEDQLLEILEALGADGIFLDTLSTASPRLRPKLDALRPGLMLAPEIHPPAEQLGVSSMSWAQWLEDTDPPGMLHLKWLAPRHLQLQIRRWNDSRSAEIATAFFNGAGLVIWENIFGSYNPWSEADRALWRQCVEILRAFPEHFANDDWEPFLPTRDSAVQAHRWPRGTAVLYTLRNLGAARAPGPLLDMAPPPPGHCCIDLFARCRVDMVESGGLCTIRVSMATLGAIAILPEDDPRVARFLAPAPPPPRTSIDHAPHPTPRRAPAPAMRAVSALPPGMVRIPAGHAHLCLAHQRRECGCYPDPGSAPEHAPHFLTGHPFSEILTHDYTVALPSYAIDETPVTNAQFAAFVEATGYRPVAPENFLRHWDGHQMPLALADHPVVHVDLEDARAYARWAGKRLPTEPEWHRAAQGDDDRAWPWGNVFEQACCAPIGAGTHPVHAHPAGRSPFGCLDCAGNVWEWTESEHDDGHTRFVMIRGGSHFQPTGSGWYTPSGPQPNTAHTKFVLLHPALDRCATVGFRCVVDLA